MDLTPLFPRYIQPRLLEALEDTPVILIHGARQTGKTTLAKSIGSSRGYSYLSFDREETARAAIDDPVGFTARLPEYVILDEVQRVPTLFSALKMSVDENRRPGRFLLTGSTNLLAMPTLSDSLAGRMEIIRLGPLTQAEIEGTRPRLIEKMFEGNFRIRNERERLGNLSERIVRGGFPAALGRPTEERRERWYNEYIEAIITKDIRSFDEIREHDIMPRLLRLIAAQTASLRNISDLSTLFGLSRPTIEKYAALLERLFLVETLPPWYTNRSQRTIKTPKLHISDTGLGCTLAGVDSEGLRSSPSILGQMLETFVYQELRRQSAWGERPVAFHHFRTRDRVEVDLVLEGRNGEIVGVEVKASGGISTGDFRGLRKLQELAGDRMKCGVLLYGGASTLPFGENLWGMPISSLWEDD